MENWSTGAFVRSSAAVYGEQPRIQIDSCTACNNQLAVCNTLGPIERSLVNIRTKQKDPQHSPET